MEGRSLGTALFKENKKIEGQEFLRQKLKN